MKKKIFLLPILIIALVSVLSSCSHKHTWSEWEIVQNANCTTFEVKSRHCTDNDCDAVENKTNYDAAKEHLYSKGKCEYCNKWIPLNVTVPEAPIVTLDRFLHSLKFTKFWYGFIFDSNSSFDLYLYYDAEMLSGDNEGCFFRYKVVDSNGYTVGSGYTKSPILSKGDKVKDQYFIVATNLDPKGSYTIIIDDFQ